MLWLCQCVIYLQTLKMQTLTRGVLQKCLLYFLGSTHQSVTV